MSEIPSPSPESNQTKPKQDIELSTAKFIQNEAKSLSVGIGTAATVGVLPDIITAPATYAEINRPSDERIHFEPLDHPMSDSEWKSITDAFAANDPDAHSTYYHPEVTNRILEYHPEVIAIDGFRIPTSTKPDTNNRLPLYTDFKEQTWTWLPVRPNKLNPQGKVAYAVAGDLGGPTDIMNYETAQMPRSDWDAPFNEAINKDLETQEDSYRKSGLYSLGLAVIGTLAGVATANAKEIKHVFAESEQESEPPLKTEPSQDEKKQQTSPLERKYSRRSAMKVITRIAGAAAIGATLLESRNHLAPAAASAKTGQERALWQTADTYLRDKFIPDVWLNGRTAMTIAKQMAAMEYLRVHNLISETTPGTVLMGTSHDSQALIYLHDKEARVQAIQEYAKQVIGITQEVVKKHLNLTEKELAQLTNNAVDYFCMAGIVPVTDFQDQIPNGDLKTYVYKSIPYMQVIPCPEIEEATTSLRV